MFAYLTSTLSGLSPYSLSTALQRQLLSFLLRRTLGHLVKQGQLDSQKIETGIGSGKIEIADVELDPEAVNKIIAGFVPLHVTACSIAKTTVKLPWPNLWNGELSISVSGLSLAAELDDAGDARTGTSLSSADFGIPGNSALSKDIAESIAVAADEALREDKEGRELEASLAQSLHLEDAGGTPKASTSKGPGTVIADLVAGLLARLRISLHDSRLRISVCVGPDKEASDATTLELCMEEFHANTRTAETSAHPGDGVRRAEILRRAEMRGVSVWLATSRSRAYAPAHRKTGARASPSSTSSEEDEDEESVYMQMSQAIPDLRGSIGGDPMRASISSESTASMYASALEEDGSPDPTPHNLASGPAGARQSEKAVRVREMILSFGSEPIILRLTSESSASIAGDPASGAGAEPPETSHSGKSSLEVEIGTVAFFCHAYQVLALTMFADGVRNALVPSTFSAADEKTRRKGDMAAPGDASLSSLSIHFAALHVVCAYQAVDEACMKAVEESVAAFWSRPSRSHPQLGHLRLRLERMILQSRGGRATDNTGGQFTLSVGDMACYEHLPKATVLHESVAPIIPILLFDPGLADQYDLPSSIKASGNRPRLEEDGQSALDALLIDAMDWRCSVTSMGGRETSTSAEAARNSQGGGSSGPFWRTSFGEKGWKVRPKQRRTSGISTMEADAKPTPPPVLKLASTQGEGTTIDIVPIHIFLDASLGARLTPLLQELVLSSEDSNARRLSGRRSDLSASFATIHPPESPRAKLRDSEVSEATGDPGTQLCLRVDLVRVELRAPACMAYDADFARSPAFAAGLDLRSGIAIVDLRDLSLQMGAGRDELHEPGELAAVTGVRFATPADAQRSDHGSLRAQGSVEAMLAFFQPVGSARAVAFAKLGKLADEDAGEATGAALRPRFRLLSQPAARATSPSAESCSKVESCLPALQASLSKPLLDGLELLADDAAQWSFEINQALNAAADEQGNEGLKILGSRFFGSRANLSLLSGSSESTETPTNQQSDSPAFSLSLTEAEMNVRVPSQASTIPSGARRFRLGASELQLLVEPRRATHSTLVQVSVLSLSAVDFSLGSQAPQELLSRTMAPSLGRQTQPVIELVFVSLSDAETSYKESRIDVLLRDLSLHMPIDSMFASDIAAFVASPEGAFEHVEPNEATRLSVRVKDVAVVIAPHDVASRAALLVGDLTVRSKFTPYTPRTSVRFSAAQTLLLLMDGSSADQGGTGTRRKVRSPLDHFSAAGFAKIADMSSLRGEVLLSNLTLPETELRITELRLDLHACADTFHVLGQVIQGVRAPAQDEDADVEIAETSPSMEAQSPHLEPGTNLLASLDESAFRRTAVSECLPDFVEDDLPSDPQFLGARRRAPHVDINEILEEDDFLGLAASDSVHSEASSAASRETATPADGAGARVLLHNQDVKVTLLDPRGITPQTDYFTNPELTIEPAENRRRFASVTRMRAENCDVRLKLFAGFDMAASRAAIEEEARRVRRRLQKIKQLLDEGQKPDDSVEGAMQGLMDSIHISLPEGQDELDAAGALRAVDEELGEQSETASDASTWQPLPGRASNVGAVPVNTSRHKSKLHRSRYSWIDFELLGLGVEYDVYAAEVPLASRLNMYARRFEILDNVRTSTWRTFLTEMHPDAALGPEGQLHHMVRVEIDTVRPRGALRGAGAEKEGEPAPHSPPPGVTEEVRVRAKVSPLRLHVDQDALDFLKKFFSFQPPKAEGASSPPPSTSKGAFIQHAEVFPIRLKLDYKPKRVDYGLIREGKTIELMNFFHFDGAEMTLRHVTLRGITGWARLFDLLNDIWTPDVKAHQLADVLSGIAPVRSLVNIGTGVADLVLLPIEQYQRDGRLLRGLQKGAQTFAKTTALEAVKLGAKLATGTQVILERAENVLGGSVDEELQGEAMRAAVPRQWHAGGRRDLLDQVRGQAGGDAADEDEDDVVGDGEERTDEGDDRVELISRYANQPEDLREGLSQAYAGLSKGLNSAAKTILAIPMDVYERGSGEAGAKPVVRALPIAMLRGATGATEAISKTLQGLQRELDATSAESSEAKYKRPATTASTSTASGRGSGSGFGTRPIDSGGARGAHSPATGSQARASSSGSSALQTKRT